MREHESTLVPVAKANAPRSAPAGRGTPRLPPWFYPTVTSLAVLAAWELLTPIFRIPAFVLPKPTVIANEIVVRFPSLVPHIGVTLFEAVGGIVVSILLAVPLALAIAYLPPFERSIYPLLVSTQAIPKVAIAPLFIVWFGFGMESKLLVAFLVAFFPVVIDTVVGLKSVDPGYIHLAKSMRASEWQVLARIRMPYALPHFFAGLKVAATFSVIGAIVAEFMGSDTGLGYMLLRAHGNVDTKLLFATIALLAIMGIVLFYAVAAIERLMIPWHVSHRRRG